MSSEADRYVESVLAALDLLTCFEADAGLRLADLHSKTKLNNSRILRLAGTLVSRGFLVYDASSSLYYLGPAIYAAGALLEPRYSDISRAVATHLKTLVSQTGDTALFSVLSGQTRLVLSKEESRDALRYTARVGVARPISGGASGRVILAYCDDHTREAAIKSIADGTEASALEERLDLIRSQGFDSSLGELAPNAFAVAKPVLTRSGDLLGVLTLAGAESKFNADLCERYVRLLSEQAEIIPADALSGLLAKSAAASAAA